jgi:hypothetical protein
MSRPRQGQRWARGSASGIGLAVCLLLGSCQDNRARPLLGLNLQLAQSAVNRDPALSSDWLALIAGREGREQVRLVRLSQGAPVPLPGLKPARCQALGRGGGWLGRTAGPDQGAGGP